MRRVEEIVQEPLYVRPTASLTRGADKAQPKVTKSFRRTGSPNSSRDASPAWPSDLRHRPRKGVSPGAAQDDRSGVAPGPNFEGACVSYSVSCSGPRSLTEVTERENQVECVRETNLLSGHGCPWR